MFQRTKICTGLLIAFGSVAAHAQNAAPADQVQRVEITGSSIKRVDAETALPVQTISREQIDTLGVTTTEQLLANVSANSMVGGTTTTQNAGAATYGLATASLRGLGSNRTLILVNGRRLANYATDGKSVDINSIPLASVERVEVLKDGASGVYGSDAVAGVINFILRKNFKGVEATAYFGKPTSAGGGKSGKGSLLLGFGDLSTDHFNVNGSIDFSHDTAIYGRQRSYANRSWDNGGAFEQSATPSGNLSTYQPGAVPGQLAGLGGGLGNPLNVGGATGNNCAANGSAWDVNDGACRFNSAPYVPLTPDISRVNGALNLRARVNDTTDFFVEGFISNTKTVINEQPSPYNASFLSTDTLFQTKKVDPVIIINPTNPVYQSLIAPYLAANHPASNGQPVTVSYRAFAGGNRIHTDDATQFHLASGIEGSVAGIDYDAVYSHDSSSVGESTQSGYQNQVQLVQLLSGNDAFNPYTTQQTPALTAAIKATNYNGPIINSTLSMDAINVKGTREVFALPGGELTVAAGVSFRKENLNLVPSAAYSLGDVSGYGGAVLPLDRSRNSSSYFAEVYAPIFKQFDADVSVRNDRYPNAQSTNPKLSLSFTPIQQIKFRGSVGTGFREASLPELYAPQVLATTNTFTDPVTKTDGQFTQKIGGNPDLAPEKSKQFSLGVVLEPVKRMSATIDFFHIRVDHEITTLDPSFIVTQAAAGIAPYTGLVTRDASGNITQIVSTNLNAGGITTSGVDVDVDWKSDRSSLGVFGVNMNGTYTHKYTTTLPDGSIQQSVGATVNPDNSALNSTGGGGITFKWRHVLQGNWSYGPYELALTQNYQSGYQDAERHDQFAAANAAGIDPATVAKVHIKAFQTFDLQTAYTGIKSMTLRVGVKNFTNRQPPESIGNGEYFQTGYDPSYYDPHGRFVYGSASYKF